MPHAPLGFCLAVARTPGPTASLGSEGEAIPVHVDLPVGLAADVDVVEVSSVVLGVGSSQQQLTTGLGVWVPEYRGK